MSSVNIINNSDEVRDELERAIQRALMSIGLTAEAYAKLECRVDTGRLRGSITFATKSHHSSGTPLRDGSPSPEEDYEMHGEPEENEVVIGTNVEYAESVELNVKPFLRPAIENHINEYKGLIESELRGR